MKYKIFFVAVSIFVTLTISACEIFNGTSQTNIDNIPDTKLSIIKEQSDMLYLGEQEITPLFKGRSDIEDWIKDIRSNKVEYVILKDDKSDNYILDIINIDNPNYKIASFYIEDNNYGNSKFNTLPHDIMKLKLNEVIYLDFDNMGIPYNVRGVKRDSTVDDVKMVFLDMKRKIDTSAVPYQELYNIYDVYPDVKRELEYENYSLISGIDSVIIDQGGFREITYFHTDLFDNDKYINTDFKSQSILSFLINTNNKVAGLRYKKARIDLN